jgi:hypothetical protein
MATFGRSSGARTGRRNRAAEALRPSAKARGDHGALPTELVAPLARLRPDLDRFLPEEAGFLSYHGYWSTHARLAALHPQLAVGAPSWREYADLAAEETGRLRRLLLNGAKRIRLSRRG